MKRLSISLFTLASVLAITMTTCVAAASLIALFVLPGYIGPVAIAMSPLFIFAAASCAFLSYVLYDRLGNKVQLMRVR